MTKGAVSRTSRIAQLTLENSRLKESLEYIIRMCDERLKEFRGCQEELDLKDKKIRYLVRRLNTIEENRERFEIYDFKKKRKEKENRRLKENIEE